MADNEHMLRRRSIRLPGYDYAATGGYFVTICTLGRICLFGAVAAGQMRLSHAGEVAQEEWYKTAEIRREVTLDAFVVMPNHIHGIVFIDGMKGQHQEPSPSQDSQDAIAQALRHNPRLPHAKHHSLGMLIGGYKAAVTRQLTELHIISGASTWQRNYYEHIIRNDDDLARLQDYISANPSRWSLDALRPSVGASAGRP